LTDILSPEEIAQWLQDIGCISHGQRLRLEQRIITWADNQKAEGRRNGIVEAARKANFVVAGIKSPSQRAAAEKVLRAVKRLLPQGSNERQEAYARGFTDGAVQERRKHTRQPKENG
jgi:hypothetical protein